MVAGRRDAGGQGVKITYDAKAMRVTNAPRANEYLEREYRAGWSL